MRTTRPDYAITLSRFQFVGRVTCPSMSIVVVVIVVVDRALVNIATQSTSGDLPDSTQDKHNTDHIL